MGASKIEEENREAASKREAMDEMEEQKQNPACAADLQDPKRTVAVENRGTDMDDLDHASHQDSDRDNVKDKKKKHEKKEDKHDSDKEKMKDKDKKKKKKELDDKHNSDKEKVKEKDKKKKKRESSEDRDSEHEHKKKKKRCASSESGILRLKEKGRSSASPDA